MSRLASGQTDHDKGIPSIIKGIMSEIIQRLYSGKGRTTVDKEQKLDFSALPFAIKFKSKH